MSADLPVVVDDVSRAFGPVVALNEVSLRLPVGVVGLLGPNGAGKSTLLKMLSGELRPSRGRVTVLGQDPFANPRIHHRTGLCPETDALFDDLSAAEFLTSLLQLRGYPRRAARDRADAWIAKVGLADAAGRRLKGFSKGMRQRVKIAAALSHEPELVLLDEPLTGLDPVWRHRVQALVREAAARGATVLFSSHVLHEVEQATRQVVLLHRGRVVAEGDAREIRALVDTFPHRIRIECAAPRDLGLRLLGWESVESVRLGEGRLEVTTPRPDLFYGRLTEAAAGQDLGITAFESPDDSLQALFETLLA